MKDMIEKVTEADIEKMSPVLGQIMASTGESIPDGWLPCDHRMLRRRVYPKLFRALGTQYGDGDGSNTAFNLPDMVSAEADVRYIVFVGLATK